MYKTSKRISMLILLSMALQLLSPFIGMGVVYLRAGIPAGLTENYRVETSELSKRYNPNSSGIGKEDTIISNKDSVDYYTVENNSSRGSASVSGEKNSPLLLFRKYSYGDGTNIRGSRGTSGDFVIHYGNSDYVDFVKKDFENEVVDDYSKRLLFNHKNDSRKPEDVSRLFGGIEIFGRSDTDHDKHFNAQLRNYFTKDLPDSNTNTLKGELGIDYKYGIRYYDVSAKSPITVNDISNKAKNSLLSSDITFSDSYSGLIEVGSDTSLWFSKDEKLLYSWGIMPYEKLEEDTDDIDTIIFISTYSDEIITVPTPDTNETNTIGKFRYYILHYNGLAKDNNEANFFYQRFYSDSFMLSGVFEGNLVKGINDKYISDVEDLTKTELIKAAWEFEEGKVNRYNPIIKYNFPIINLSFSIKDTGGTSVDSKLTVENTLNGLDDFMYYKKYGSSEADVYSGGIKAGFMYTDDVGLYTIGYIKDTDDMRNFGLFASGLSSNNDAKGVYVGLAEEIYKRVVNKVGGVKIELSEKYGKNESITYKNLIDSINEGKSNDKKLKPYERAILEAWFNASVENIKSQLKAIAELEKSKRAIAEGDILKLYDITLLG